MFSAFRDTMQAISDETKCISVEELSVKTGKLSTREKEFIFNYVREGDLPDHLRINGGSQKNTGFRINEPIEHYKRNVFLLIEVILNY